VLWNDKLSFRSQSTSKTPSGKSDGNWQTEISTSACTHAVMLSRVSRESQLHQWLVKSYSARHSIMTTRSTIVGLLMTMVGQIQSYGTGDFYFKYLIKYNYCTVKIASVRINVCTRSTESSRHILYQLVILIKFWRTERDHRDAFTLHEHYPAGPEFNPTTFPWKKQLTWLRIVHSGGWCLRLVLCTPSGACHTRRRHRFSDLFSMWTVVRPLILQDEWN